MLDFFCSVFVFVENDIVASLLVFFQENENQICGGRLSDRSMARCGNCNGFCVCVWHLSQLIAGSTGWTHFVFSLKPFIEMKIDVELHIDFISLGRCCI